MLWQQNAYRENAFTGRAAYGWFRPAGLGQVPSEAYALGPRSVQTAGGALRGRQIGQEVTVRAPSGQPVVEVTETPSGRTEVKVQPAVLGVPLVPTLVALGTAALIYALARD